MNTSDRRASLSRRAFLRRTACFSGVAAAPSFLSIPLFGAGGSVTPNNKITLALIGKGAMGSGHLNRLIGDPSVQLIGLCEVDPIRREAGRGVVQAKYAGDRGQQAWQGFKVYNDYRELLARSDLDGVVIATPDHWHALQSVDAAKAGKDVYCEKPISMTVEEGRKVVETVHRYGRVFQTGTQYRSIPQIRQVCRFVREGGLGRVRQVFTLLNSLSLWTASGRAQPYAKVLSPDECGKGYVPMDFALPPEPVPDGLDWDLWVGPAPWRDYNRLYHENPSPGVVPWSFSDAFGVTSLTWHLAHSADVIQFALGMETSGPVEIIHPNSGEYPTMTCRYANGTLLHFVDNWQMVKDLYQAVPPSARLAGNFGGLFVGERGWITSMTTGGPIEGDPASLFEAMGMADRNLNIGANNHHANWFECIRTREQPSASEEIGHRSASLGHVANISWRTGQSLRWDPAKEVFADNEPANRLRARAQRAPWRI